jgi:hypothetical protein
VSAVRGGEAIALSGPPRRVSALLEHRVEGERVTPVTVRLKKGPPVVRALLKAKGPGLSELRVTLPAHTAPGTYPGEAVVGDATLGVSLEVSPVLDVGVEPGITAVSAEPGGRAEFDLVVANLGNVMVDVPEAAALDLDADDQERALGRALRADLAEGERRVDRLFEELRAFHGGEGRVAVLEGAGGLEPGDQRSIHCRLEVPMLAAPGGRYSGSWDIGNAGHFLTVDVTKPPSGTPRTRGRRKP